MRNKVERERNRAIIGSEEETEDDESRDGVVGSRLGSSNRERIKEREEEFPGKCAALGFLR